MHDFMKEGWTIEITYSDGEILTGGSWTLYQICEVILKLNTEHVDNGAYIESIYVV